MCSWSLGKANHRTTKVLLLDQIDSTLITSFLLSVAGLGGYFLVKSNPLEYWMRHLQRPCCTRCAIEIRIAFFFNNYADILISPSEKNLLLAGSVILKCISVIDDSYMGELVDDFLEEQFHNDWFIYLWKCIILTGRLNKITN